MTLGGLALSIGVLVDNSIVVLENISKKLEGGLSAQHAAHAGATEVAMPVLASTLATLIVLFPVVFLTGIVKILFTALAKAVIFAMIGSYIAAMAVMPLFASRFLQPVSIEKLPRFFVWTHRLIHNITEFYGKALNHALLIVKQFYSVLLVFFFWCNTDTSHWNRTFSTSRCGKFCS